MPFVSVGDGRMHYVERGAGEEVVLFVHRWLSSHRWWLPVLDRLPSGVRGYAVDLRGAGESEPATRRISTPSPRPSGCLPSFSWATQWEAASPCATPWIIRSA
jgi:pimeloyl-ACP methyl ester carboxylesterase